MSEGRRHPLLDSLGKLAVDAVFESEIGFIIGVVCLLAVAVFALLGGFGSWTPDSQIASIAHGLDTLSIDPDKWPKM